LVLVAALIIGLVVAVAGGGNGPGIRRPSRADIPGTAYAGSTITTGLKGAYSIALDSAGTLYVVDSGNHQIRTLTAGGTLGVFAGAGIPGFLGDGGPASDARINKPGAAVVGPDGSVYIGDAGNHRIRKVTPNGIITTIAGNGTEGYSGDGGPATAAQLSSAERIAVDPSGNVYIADYGNNRIRKIDASTGVITTIAGTGAEGYNGGGGPAAQAEINSPNDVAVTDDGTVYFANLGSDTVQKISPSGILATVAGTGQEGFSGDGGPATSAKLANPQVDVARDGTLYIAEYFNHRVRKISSNGVITTIAGNGTAPGDGDNPTGEGGPAVDAQIGNPSGVAVDATGAVYISDTASTRVTRVGTNGIITTVLRAP
jgi:serine/threonine-protein kinase